MFSHFREYLFKAIKTASKKKKKSETKQQKNKQENLLHFQEDRNLVWLSRLGTPVYTALLTQTRANWRLPEKVKTHELKFHQWKRRIYNGYFTAPRVPTPSWAGRQQTLAGRTPWSPPPRCRPVSGQYPRKPRSTAASAQAGSEWRVRPAKRSNATIFTSP